ncbi:MAG TPA: hypothetical protein VJ724_04955, partial [Tahibacter sp.]|nr:hypothetical protein [Tahibacter sp.]
IGRALIRLLMKPARVVDAERIGERFRLITLESAAFRGLDWIPGQKLQIAMGSAFVARTFTPIDWDAANGRTRLVGYAHGDAPGSAWLRNASRGDDGDVFGPRASLATTRMAGACVVFGDETSIGLVHATQRHSPGGTVRCLIEANDVADARAALERLDVDGAAVFERSPDDAHLDVIERRLPALAAGGATFVLTGKASSVKRMHRALKALGVPASRLLAKPYWAPGRTGLD